MNVITIYTNKFLEFSFQRTLFFIHKKVNKCKKLLKMWGCYTKMIQNAKIQVENSKNGW